MEAPPSPEEKETVSEPRNDTAEQGSENEESQGDSHEIEIPNDDLVVQILARLDGQAYRRALYQDAGSINDNFLIPPQFPWHTKKRLPQKMKTMPRDIDDLHIVSHCEDVLRTPFGEFAGSLGFGRYENGQSRGNYSNAIPLEAQSLAPGSGAIAAARRSLDPGVLELHCQTKLPSSIDTLMDPNQPQTQAPAERWRAELMKDPEQAKMLSHMPFHWEKKSEPSSSADQQPDLQASSDGDLDFNSQKLAGNKARSRAQLDVASSCRRKWNVSMKVNGVSSRSTILPPSTVIAGSDRGPENKRKVLRPMLSLATLPQSVQSGETVPTEKALELDNAGLAHTLGSYDCRFTDALLNPKRDSSNRMKRVEVGRTRLVWSNLIQGDEPYLPSTRNRINYNSLITGKRMDASKCQRPLEVKVGVRLNGTILMEEAFEEIPTTTTSNVRKRTRQAENQGPASKTRNLVVLESRTDEDIESALDNNCTDLEVKPDVGRAIKQRARRGSVVYMEIGASESRPEIDRNDIIASLLKSGQNQKKSVSKKLKRSASSELSDLPSQAASNGSLQGIRSSNAPRFACVPLEDGILRTLCMNAGNMAGTPVHQVILDISDQQPGKRCSVCWSDEGSGREGVQECIKCGLMAHTSCCLDKGEFRAVSSEGQQRPKDVEQNEGPGAKPTVPEPADDNAESWKCAVCCRFAEVKPRRNSRMPSRFADGETYTTSSHMVDCGIESRHANTPGPRCSLCPHRGGAMSPLETGDPSVWAHEVCRVWSGLDPSNDTAVGCLPLLQQVPSSGSPLSNVCALCGLGATKDKRINAGLTRCAARGCLVAFHPMCALLASKVGIDEKSNKAKSARTRKTRHTDQAAEDKRPDTDERVEADKKLCKDYTLQLVQVSRIGESTVGSSEDDTTTTIPIAFCGIHNPERDDSFFGCLPGGTF